jgi:hypothetical protein
MKQEYKRCEGKLRTKNGRGKETRGGKNISKTENNEGEGRKEGKDRK